MLYESEDIDSEDGNCIFILFYTVFRHYVVLLMQHIWRLEIVVSAFTVDDAER